MRLIRQIITTAMMIWSISLSVSGSTQGVVPDRDGGAPFQKCADVWGVVAEFCDVQTLANWSRCSSKANTDAQKILRTLKHWKDGGGLLYALLNDSANSDQKTLRYLGKRYDHVSFNELTYQEILDILTTYVVLRNGADVAWFSVKLAELIQDHPLLKADRGEAAQPVYIAEIQPNGLSRMGRIGGLFSQKEILLALLPHVDGGVTISEAIATGSMGPIADIRLLLKAYRALDESNQKKLLPRILAINSTRYDLETARQIQQVKDSTHPYAESVMALTRDLQAYMVTLSWVANKVWGGVKRLAGK